MCFQLRSFEVLQLVLQLIMNGVHLLLYVCRSGFLLASTVIVTRPMTYLTGYISLYGNMCTERMVAYCFVWHAIVYLLI